MERIIYKGLLNVIANNTEAFQKSILLLERMWRKGKTPTLLGGFKLVQSLWKTLYRFLKKLKIELPYDLAIPLLGIYLEKTLIQKDICTSHVHSSTIYNSQKARQQPKCPLTGEWIKRWVCCVLSRSVVSDSL